ncbi:MAG: hypothetical protein RL375_2977 [Pseudomonadota bacterium]
MINADDTPLDAPGREGSTPCCQILHLLHKHRDTGMPSADLQVFLGLSRTDLIQALRGLQARHRIVPIGRGTAARWWLAQYAPTTQTQDAA